MSVPSSRRSNGADRGSSTESTFNSEFAELGSEPAFAAYLEQQAAASAPTSPEQFGAFLLEDRKAEEKPVRIANTKREEYVPQ